MELKSTELAAIIVLSFTFNRTAYGIEITVKDVSDHYKRSFNRTAYGIEMCYCCGSAVFWKHF